MSQRTVSVVLQAQVSNYLQNMSAAERRTLEVERAMMTATQRFEQQNRAIEATGKGFLIAGGLAAAGLALAIKASAEYGGKLAQLQSLTHASQGEMNRLSDAAMTQGKAFGQNALQVADAEIELTKAGRSTAQMLGGDLKGALALAAAGQMDVAKATQIGVTAVTQFVDSGATIPHVADLLAAGADKALGSVEDLGMALNQGGLVAAQMGLNVDQTVGTLSAFANAGLLGSDAGTSFKTMLLSLQSPSKQAQGYLKEYNITAYDSKGAFVGITNLAGQLHDKLSGVSQAQRDAALSTIFGTDAIRAANVLFKEGAGGLQGWIDKVNASGFASAQAAGKLNSLQGDLTKLSAAWENDLIKSGQASDGFLRGRVQSITSAVQAVGDLPPQLQTVGTTAVAGVAAVGLFGGALLLGVPKIAAFRKGLETMNLTGKQAAGIFGKGSALLLGVGAVVAGFAGLAEHGTASEEGIKKTAQAIKSGWSGVNDLFGKSGTGVLDTSGLKASLNNLDGAEAHVAKFIDGMGGITHLADVFKGNEATFDAMGQQLAGLAEQDYSRAATSFGTLVQKFHLGAAEQAHLLEEMPAYRDQLAHMAQQAGVSTSKQSLLNYAQLKGADALKILGISNENAAAGGEANAAAVKVLAGNADQATTSVDDLVTAIKGLDRGQLDARSAARAMQQAISDAADAAKKNGATLDITTKKGRDNQAALDGIASAAMNSAAAYEKQTHDAKGAQKIIDDGKQAFINAARAMGMGRDAAAQLAEKLLGIPGTVNPYVGLKGADDAISKAANLKSYIEWLQKQGVVNVAVHADESINQRLGRASGGEVPASLGIQGVDSVPAMLMPDEHVWTTTEVSAAGGHGAMHRLRAAALRGDLAGYAKGGRVKKAKGPSARSVAQAAIAWGGRVSVKKGKIVRESDVARQDRIAREQDAARKATVGAYKRAQAREKAAQKAQDAAQKRYDAIGGGKKDRAAKGRARAALAAAKKRTDAAGKTADRIKKAHDDDVQARNDARAAAAQLRQNREDFQSAERRNPNRRTEDPLAYVDQLRAMSRDENYSAARRKKFDQAANAQEAALVKLTASSAEAAKKLDTLKQSSEQLHDSIASAVTGSFRASAAGSTPTASSWIYRNGMRFQSYTSGPTASSLASYYTAGGSKAKRFADGLAALRRRGLNEQLLAEIAGYGVDQGQPIIDALLAGNASQLAQVNRGYTAIGTYAGQAGTTVADANFAKQIAAAKTNADQITAQIKDDGEKLRKIIATAFGLKGYASGTSSATPGVHLVGEEGPELVGMAGGEWVANARDTARWIRGGGGHAAGQAGTVRVEVTTPASMALTDADGVLMGRVRLEARGVATQVVQARHDAIGVRLMGAAI